METVAAGKIRFEGLKTGLFQVSQDIMVLILAPLLLVSPGLGFSSL